MNFLLGLLLILGDEDEIAEELWYGKREREGVDRSAVAVGSRHGRSTPGTVG